MTIKTTGAGAYWYPGLPRFLEDMEAWFETRQRWAFDHAILPDGTWRLFLGVLAFGGHVDVFLDYCVPSLLAAGNLSALADPLVVIHTDEASFERVASGVENLRAHARIEIEVVPQGIIDQVGDHAANKYWLLSCVNNMHMQRAKYMAHAYHMLMPDHFYAGGYFANLARLAKDGKQVIVQGAISADLDKIGSALKLVGCRLWPDRLTAAALNCLHEQCKPAVMNGPRADYPGGNYFLMVGKDRLEVMSPHMSLVYFSHAVLMRAPLRMFNTVDTQLPWFVPEDVEPYVPAVDDGMTYVELSPPAKAYSKSDAVSLVELCVRFWLLGYCTRGYERYLALTTRMPLPGGFVSPVAAMDGDEMDAVKTRIRSTISQSYDAIVPLVPEELRVDPLTRLEREAKAA